MKSIRLVASLLIAVASLGGASRAGTVALWLFDEPLGASPNLALHDAGPQRHWLSLGPAAEIAPGKYGHALHSIAVLEPMANNFAAWSSRRADVAAAASPNVTDSRLNLGAHDWTIECWLRLDGDARAEGVLFEIGAEPTAANELLTRFSVLPAENAFAFTGISTAIAPVAGVLTKRVEYPNPEGPPGGVALIHATTLALTDSSLPRGRWFHVALVHTAERSELRLFIDGRARAVAAVRVDPLPHGARPYVSIGRDGRCGRPLAGAIDELRVSDAALYAREFSPPASFSSASRER